MSNFEVPIDTIRSTKFRTEHQLRTDSGLVQGFIQAITSRANWGDSGRAKALEAFVAEHILNWLGVLIVTSQKFEGQSFRVNDAGLPVGVETPGHMTGLMSTLFPWLVEAGLKDLPEGLTFDKLTYIVSTREKEDGTT